MPGMTSVSGKGRRDIQPANCIYETGSDCDKVRVRESAPGWAATVMSPAAGKLQVLGPKGPLLTNRMTELVTYGSVGGVGGNSGPYPAAADVLPQGGPHPLPQSTGRDAPLLLSGSRVN